MANINGYTSERYLIGTIPVGNQFYCLLSSILGKRQGELDQVYIARLNSYFYEVNSQIVFNIGDRPDLFLSKLTQVLPDMTYFDIPEFRLDEGNLEKFKSIFREYGFFLFAQIMNHCPPGVSSELNLESATPTYVIISRYEPNYR